MAGNRPVRNCRFLLASLIALLVAFPLLDDVAQPLIVIIPLAGVFLAGVVVVDSGPVDIRRAIVLAAAQVGLTILSLVLRESGGSYLVPVALALIATIALILFSTSCVLRYVLRAKVITRDQIYAGICMYIMLGFAFGGVFYLVNILNPESFTGDRPDLLYFSFVTLATLGYGDITPHTKIARSLAVIEALVGMLYIAVFMARLVSMRSNDTGTD